MKKDNRFRNFVIVFYPDSCPANFIDIINDFHCQAFLSPLHDKDVNADGEFKKPHYHLMLMFEGNKSISQIQDFSDRLSGVLPQEVNSIRSHARYLVHLDNPDKFQYNISDVKSFCGADYSDIINLASDKYKAIFDMIQFCNDNNIVEFCDLVNYACTNNFAWFRVLADNGTMVVKEYLKSCFLKQQRLSTCSNNHRITTTDCTTFVNSDNVELLPRLDK